jgi:hypothetical protein
LSFLLLRTSSSGERMGDWASRPRVAGSRQAARGSFGEQLEHVLLAAQNAAGRR